MKKKRIMEEINNKEIKKNKIRLGILGCGFACHEGLSGRLNPWFDRIEAKTDFVFSFVSARFREYEELNINQDNAETVKAFKFLLENKLINYLEVPEKSMSEAEARNLALKHLLDEKCDYILLLDLSDEYYNQEQIHNILYFLNQDDNKFYDWLSIPFKNYIFSGKEWVDGFCPPRIFKTKIVGGTDIHYLDSFFWDNDVRYKVNETFYSYQILPNKSIPKNLLCSGVRHMTWLHTNGENKEKYQRKHFNNICSYKFNKEKNELEFDLDYYKDKELPTVYKD